MDVAIRTEGLTKYYGPTLALSGLDMTVKRGEIFGFLGPNGAGKSTTIRLLLDLIRPTSGRAEILGHDCQHESVAVRSLVGYLPGDVRLYPNLTGHQTIELFGSLRNRRPDPVYARNLAERLQVDLARKSGELSKGNRQKLGLLVALLAEPPVLLLDEPTSGLDPLLQHTVHELLQHEAARGTTVFFSSHVMSEVEETCERVGILREGTLVEVAPVADLKARSIQRVEVRFAGKSPGPDSLNLPGIREVDRHNSLLELEVSGPIDPLLKRLADFEVLTLESRTPTLEEILLAFYERGEAQ